MKMENVYYINLNSATERKSAFSRRFMQFADPSWRLTRFEAISAQDQRVQGYPGASTVSEKACFLSHMHLMDKAIFNNTKPFLICEDDCLMGPYTAPLLEKSLDFLKDKDWDLVFTQVGLSSIAQVKPLLKVHRALYPIKSVSFHPLKTYDWSGASCYLVNPKSAKKFRSVFSNSGRLDEPYDFFIRRMIREGHLNALFTFPFLTSLSVVEGDSFIQNHFTQRIGMALAAFGNLMCVNADEVEIQKNLDLLRSFQVDRLNQGLGLLAGVLGQLEMSQ